MEASAGLKLNTAASIRLMRRHANAPQLFYAVRFSCGGSVLLPATTGGKKENTKDMLCIITFFLLRPHIPVAEPFFFIILVFTRMFDR